MFKSFNKTKEDIIKILKKQYPEYDYSYNSQINVFVDTIQYLQSNLREIYDKSFQELFLDSQMDKNNIKSILSMFSYERQWVSPQNGFLDVTFKREFIYKLLTLLNLDSTVTINFNKGSYLYQYNIPFQILEDKQYELTYERLQTLYDIMEDLVLNNQIQVIQIDTYPENKNEFEITTERYQKFKLNLPKGYIIPSTQKQKLVNIDDNTELNQEVQLYYYELYNIISEGKIGLLLNYDENNDEWYIILSEFFNQNIPIGNYKLYISFDYSLGENGNISQKFINGFQDIDSQITIEFFKDNTFYQYSVSDILNITNSEISQDEVVSQTNMLPLNNGKGMEDIEEFVQNQIQYNKTIQRQITYEDYILLTKLFFTKVFPNYNIKFNIQGKLNWYQNNIFQYLLVYDLSYNKINKESFEFKYIQKQLLEYLTSVSLMGITINILEGKEKYVTLNGEITFNKKFPKDKFQKQMKLIEEVVEMGHNLDVTEVINILKTEIPEMVSYNLSLSEVNMDNNSIKNTSNVIEQKDDELIKFISINNILTYLNIRVIE